MPELISVEQIYVPFKSIPDFIIYYLLTPYFF